MSHIEVIYSWDLYTNFPIGHYDNIFSEKLVNELHDCIEKHPHVIKNPKCIRRIIRHVW